MPPVSTLALQVPSGLIATVGASPVGLANQPTPGTRMNDATRYCDGSTSETVPCIAPETPKGGRLVIAMVGAPSASGARSALQSRATTRLDAGRQRQLILRPISRDTESLT